MPLFFSKIFSNRPAFTTMLIDWFLIFQFNLCNSDSRDLLPNKGVLIIVLLMGTALDSWLFITFYLFIMGFSVVSVALGKLFPKVIGVPLTGFYKKHATPKVFKEYCGNPFSAVAGGPGKVLTAGGGRIALAMGAIIVGQDALHKSGIGQPPRYMFEKWANGGVHPSGKPFMFQDNGPSWGDSISSRFGSDKPKPD